VLEAAENFAGLKDSSGNLENIAGYTAAGLAVLMGRDHLVLEGLERGCAGAVCACGNVAPRAFVELYAAFRSGDLAKAERLQALIEPLRATFSLATFPSIVKEALEMIGHGVGGCRRPVGPVPAAARARLIEVLAALREADCLLAAPVKAAGR
jgi:4-hydroxy-tetrahydrodipicolinate synthase